jgi:maltose-binding protein MalE
MRRLLKTFGAVTLMALLLAACGGGTTATPTTAPAASGSAAEPTAAAAPAAAPSSVANCATSGPKVDKLTFWTRSKDGDPDYASIKAIADAYTAAAGSPVELVTIPDADFKAKMSISAPAGEGPDVYRPAGARLDRRVRHPADRA